MKFLFPLLAAAALLVSCSGRDSRTVIAEARTAEDSADIPLALERYEEAVAAFPAEAVAETAMYRIVMLRAGLPGDRDPALAAQHRYLRQFPDGPNAPKVMFMLAFLYNNELVEIDSARKYYERFIALYPGHELAPSARFELENLGRGPEELLEGGDPVVAGGDGREPAGGRQ